MKTQIRNLISKNEGTLKINRISRLERYKGKSATGLDLDKLTLVFGAYKFQQEITSRDYDGIVDEMIIITELYMQEYTKKLCSDIRAGYLDKSDEKARNKNMVTVRDIIEKNEEQRIIIDLKPNRSDTEPLSTELYDGMLHDVPEELRELEVLRTGWGIGAGCHIVSVIKD